MDATTWDERYEDEELVWSVGPNRFLVEEVAGLTAGRALDVAAGEGRNAIWLAEQGWRVTAVDFSRVGIDKGRRIAGQRRVEVDWLVEDVTDWTPEEQAFDLVIVFYLQLSAPDRRAAHSRAGRAVAPSGTLLIVGHDRDNLTRGVGGPPDPALLLTAAETTADLEGTGLQIERAGQVRRPVDTGPEEPGVAIDCLVRARRPREGS